MRVLMLGADGFIGSHLLAALQAFGHSIVPAVRNPERADRLLRTPASIAVDLNRDTSVQAWMPRLEGIDAVVNCAGVLRGTRTQSIAAIHVDAPRALYEACERSGVRRVVLVSAVSADAGVGTAYADTKRAGEEVLRASRLDWVILRPSLVHAPGVYGGSALLRALASLPFAIPLPGDGSQAFQPIAMDDLCRVVLRAIESPDLVRRSIDPVGPQVVTLRELLVDTRRWLGLPPAPTLRIPAWMVRIATLAGGLGSGPMNATALRQLDHGNTASYERFAADSGTTALSWNEALLRHPSRWQDRWHARLYFVRPILRVSLVLLWLGSSVAGLLAPDTWAALVGAQLGIGTGAAATMLSAACLLDLALAFLLAIHWRPGLVTLAQFAVVAVYTVLATFVVPALWLDPFGSLLKNLPILAAILAHGALEADR
jgi:uncharacterized protein YbjT (DUF2867 family)